MKPEPTKSEIPWTKIPFEAAIIDATGNQSKLQKREYQTDGIFPVIDQGQESIAGYTDNYELLYKGSLPVILFGDHTRTFKYVDFPFVLGADGVKALVTTKYFDAKFVYFYFQSIKIESRGYSRHFKFLKEFYIPMFPLSEQRCIVKILERADALRKKWAEVDAKAERILPALFIKMFGEPSEWLSTANTKPIGSLVNVRGGGTPSKNNPDYWKGSIPWVSPKDMKQDILFDAMEHISDLAIEESSANYINPGAVLIVVRGMILAHTIPIALAGTRLTINQDMKALQPNCDDIDSNYLYAALKASSSALLSQVGTAGHGTRKLDTDALLKTQILIPSRSKLDTFRKEMTLCREVVSGINKTKIQIEKLFELLLHRAFSGDLTAKWREAHITELFAEMEQQTKILGTTAELHYEQLTLIESKDI